VDIIPVVDEGLGNSAYVVDLGDGGALVVDPERDPRPYLATAEERGLTPRFVVETHLHADFVSGGRELAAVGAALLAPAGSDLRYAYRPLEDGDELDLGGLRLRVIATPGHTPEHLAYLLVDGARPIGLFSGGTLIAGGIARTDLLSPELTEPLARDAYRSIRERLLTLPDDVAVYPTHGAGSFCSAGPGGDRTTTIGRERAANPLLADDPDEDTFVTRLLGGYGSFPPYFLELRDVNRAGPRVHGQEGPPLPPLSPAGVAAAVTDGAELVDTRSMQAFADGHVPGALSNPWRSQFATWLGWLVARDRDLVFVTDDDTDHRALVWAALTVGFERLRGVLAGGMDAWTADGRPVTTTPLVTAERADDRRIVDVRQRSEHADRRVAGSLHVELGDLSDDPTTVDDGPLLLHCGHGERAMSAASLLERAGRHDVAVLAGGPDDLAESGLRIEDEA
jgi:hydroxyacylglutathione hydrolase